MKLNGREISGAPLEQLLHRLMTYRKYLRLVERRGHVREAIEALLEADAHDKSFFDSQDAAGRAGRAPDDPDGRRHRAARRREQVVQPGDRGSLERLPAPQHHLARLRDVARLPDAAEQLPRDSRHQAADDGGDDERGSANRSRRPGRRKPTGAAAPSAAGQSASHDVTITSLDELLEYFVNAGKKGVAINRYKGLGEMNPDSCGRRR